LFSKDGWLNTGDLGFLVKGDLFVTGRFKDIIFINGQNYFSYDLEQIAQRVEGIETGRIVVVGDADDNLKRDIVNIYVVHKKDLESFVPIAKSLREVINNVAGINVDYIIPVKSIPKTTSGKVQRYKLKDMFRSGLFDDTMKTLDMLMKQLVKSKNKTIVCRNETDRKLIEIIEKILNTSIDSIDAEFFKLGGNSLKAAEMCSEISSVFGVEVLISKIFEFNDISALSDYIDKCEKSTCKSITKLGEKEHYEMSPAQKRMFIINKLNDQDTSYNIPVLLSVDGEIDIDRLENVFFQIIHRHEILRTNMFLVDGEPRQIINSDFVFKIERCYDADKSIEEIFADFVRVFDLEKDLLIRVKYVVERSNEAYIMFDFHHIVCDGTSLGILVNEIVTMYHGKTLEPLDISYKDYSSWKNSEVKLMDKQKKFFVNLFGKPTQKLNLYHDFDTTTSNAAKGSSLNFYISEEYTQKIKAYVDRSDSTLYLVLLSVYMILLHKYSGQEDIVVGTPFADREKVELQKLVGLFVNTVPIRSNIDPALKFEDYINTLKQTVLGAYDSQGYPLDNIINDLRLRKDENEMLFSTLFTLQNMDIPPFQLGDAHLSVYDCDVGSTKFDISLEAMEKQNKVMLKFRYNTMVFRENTIVGFAEHYVNILKSVLDSSDIKISDINVISSSELRQLMSFSQSSQVNIPDKNFIDLFEEHVNECSDRIAIVYGENRLSYIELSNRVDCIVQILNERGNYGSRFIPLVMEPCIDMIAGMLAIIK
ncbi:MAG: hypothetical protein GX660_18695, partial [Clostridiaceae bacterium]|nr:hypothetical protein [Clostridiaceae bacterium]